ncbi:MAG TPA: VTT domain-containing protein [Rhodospirillaceae bacterium]|nr:VTT domain-containing protein [Rhodospirillaceae bacterium]
MSAGFQPRLMLKGLVLILSLAIFGWLLNDLGLRDLLGTGWMDNVVRGHGLSGEALFLLVGCGAIAIGLPRQAVCFLAGYGFGLGWGVGLASLASLGGCLLSFFYARWLGRDLVIHRFAERIGKIDAFLHDNPMTMTILIRFLPVGSNLLTNLLAGVSSVRPLPFLTGSLLGYLPQTLVFVLLGSGIQVDPLFRISLSIGLFVLSALLGVFLYRRFRHGHSYAAELDE